MFFKVRKDGGPDSNVTGYWLIEWKSGFSVALLRFSHGSREAFHSHAFHSISWILKGFIQEERIKDKVVVWRGYTPSLIPLFTSKNNLHRVYGMAPVTWALTFRGPWEKQWKERFDNGREVTLGHGRVILEEKTGKGLE